MNDQANKALDTSDDKEQQKSDKQGETSASDITDQTKNSESEFAVLESLKEDQ